ncbi:MAG: curved DNA-binding protein CbpA [Psychroserpens sp.]|jgi:curved DNA-binding protein CbpA
MDIEKDYYAILGVLPSAEIIVIKAAYKALIKVYHPDRCKSSKEAAHARTIELNEAYVALSDVSKRKEYDNHRKPNNNNFSQDGEAQPDFTTAFDILEQDWQVAIKYEPELKNVVNSLSKLSSKLVFFYKLTMIESKQFDKKEIIAAKMEQDFLSLYFGTNEDIQKFAKKLLHDNERDAAKELNKAISVLGKGVNSVTLIEQIKKEFRLIKAGSEPDNSLSGFYSFVVIVLMVFFMVLWSSN